MKTILLLLSALLLIASSGLSAEPPRAEGIPLKVQLVPGSNYCHLKFPAIREETLSWNHPVLKGADSADIIDFYGPCDHDPLGKDEIQAQKADVMRRRWD